MKLLLKEDSNYARRAKGELVVCVPRERKKEKRRPPTPSQTKRKTPENISEMNQFTIKYRLKSEASDQSRSGPIQHQ